MLKGDLFVNTFLGYGFNLFGLNRRDLIVPEFQDKNMGGITGRAGSTKIKKNTNVGSTRPGNDQLLMSYPTLLHRLLGINVSER